MTDQNFGIKTKNWKWNWPIKIDENKNELVQQWIRIKNSAVNKHNDAIWNIYSHFYTNKWHGIRPTISSEYVYVKSLYALSQ